MADDPKLIAFEYLLGASKCSLQNAMLHRLADAQNRRKELFELLDAWAEKRAEAMLLSWFLERGEELAGSLGSMTRSPRVTEIQRLVPAEKPGPQKSLDFRETLRSLVESA
jgi:hypothetical protein